MKGCCQFRLFVFHLPHCSARQAIGRYRRVRDGRGRAFRACIQPWFSDRSAQSERLQPHSFLPSKLQVDGDAAHLNEEKLVCVLSLMDQIVALFELDAIQEAHKAFGVGLFESAVGQLRGQGNGGVQERDLLQIQELLFTPFQAMVQVRKDTHFVAILERPPCSN